MDVKETVLSILNDLTGEDLSQLTLAEQALIAGLPQAPSIYSPFAEFSANELVVRNKHIRSNLDYKVATL